MSIVRVNDDVCVGCGICTTFCPVEALGGAGIIRLDTKICTDCLECIETCPVDALEVMQ